MHPSGHNHNHKPKKSNNPHSNKPSHKQPRSPEPHSNAATLPQSSSDTAAKESRRRARERSRRHPDGSEGSALEEIEEETDGFTPASSRAPVIDRLPKAGAQQESSGTTVATTATSLSVHEQPSKGDTAPSILGDKGAVSSPRTFRSASKLIARIGRLRAPEQQRLPSARTSDKASKRAHRTLQADARLACKRFNAPDRPLLLVTDSRLLWHHTWSSPADATTFRAAPPPAAPQQHFAPETPTRQHTTAALTQSPAGLGSEPLGGTPTCDIAVSAPARAAAAAVAAVAAAVAAVGASSPRGTQRGAAQGDLLAPLHAPGTTASLLEGTPAGLLPAVELASAAIDDLVALPSSGSGARSLAVAGGGLVEANTLYLAIANWDRNSQRLILNAPAHTAEPCAACAYICHLFADYRDSAPPETEDCDEDDEEATAHRGTASARPGTAATSTRTHASPRPVTAETRKSARAERSSSTTPSATGSPNQAAISAGAHRALLRPLPSDSPSSPSGISRLTSSETQVPAPLPQSPGAAGSASSPRTGTSSAGSSPQRQERVSHALAAASDRSSAAASRPASALHGSTSTAAAVLLKARPPSALGDPAPGSTRLCTAAAPPAAPSLEAPIRSLLSVRDRLKTATAGLQQQGVLGKGAGDWPAEADPSRDKLLLLLDQSRAHARAVSLPTRAETAQLEPHTRTLPDR